MASLTGTKVSDTYQQLLKLTSQGVGADASAKYIEDGLGTDTALSLSTTRVGVGTASPAEMLEIYNATSPAIQLNDGGDYQAIMRLAGNDLEIRGSGGKLELYNGANDGDSSTLAMTIDSSQRVGIGTDSPDTRLTIAEARQGNASNTILNQQILHIDDTTAWGSLDTSTRRTGGGVNFSGVYNSSNDQVIFAGLRGLKENSTDNNYDGALILATIANGGNLSEKMRITSVGDVMLGNQTMTDHTYQTLGVRGDSSSGVTSLTLLSAASNTSQRSWAITSNYSAHGNLDFKYSSDRDGTPFTNTAMIINSSGNVGIGTTSVNSNAKMHISGGNSNQTSSSNNTQLTVESGGTAGIQLLTGADGIGGFWIGDVNGSESGGKLYYNNSDNSWSFFNAGSTNSVNITSSGKLGIGTTFGENIASVGDGNLTVRSSDSSNHYNMVNVWQHSNSSTNIEQRIGWAFGDDGGAENAFGFAGYVGIGKEGDWVTDANRDAYMSFAVAENNTVSERMRITSSGRLVATATSTKSPINTAHTFYINQADSAMVIDNESSGNAFGLQVRYSATGHGTSGYFISCYANPSGSLQARFIVAEDGDVTNANNSYGAISDQRVKKDITDANSQWDDIKAIKIRNYKKDEAGDGSVQIGVVAQELEEAGMNGLVDEMEATDIDVENFPNINEGDKIKSVKYSVLYMKAIKALQEAMSKIETLESKIEELEPAEQDDGPVNSIKERVNSLEARVNDLENG